MSGSGSEYIYIHVKGMSSLRSLIPFRLSHLLYNSLKHQLMHELNCTLQIHLGFNVVGHVAVLRGRLDHQVHLHMRMRNSVHLGVRAHPDRSCDFVNKLARETRWLSCTFARKGSQEKALRIESPPSGKHLWTTANLARLPSPDRRT